MALSFNGTTDLGVALYSAITSFPVSIGSWVKGGAIYGAIAVYANNASTNEYMGTYVDNTGANGSGINTRSGGAVLEEWSSLKDTSNWQYVLGVWTDGTTRTIYVNGTAVSGGGATRNWPSGSPNNFGIGYLPRLGAADFWAGSIDEPAMWSGGLSADEAKLLAGGWDARFIRRASLALYWPNILAANNVDVVGGVTMTLTGTSDTTSVPIRRSRLTAVGAGI
jgi:hypothetical protein